MNMNKLPANLLSIGADAKTYKGESLGFLTGILYLSPERSSGYQTCPMAQKAGCVKACLNSAGRGAFNKVQQARLRKTKHFFENRAEFMTLLASNIAALTAKANKLGKVPLVRLNGTSDIRWENVPVMYKGITYANIMACFPTVQFYDYTKDANRIVPSNYDLTFSYSGVNSFREYNDKAIAKGMRIAVVFRTEASIPATFNGLSCIGGDDSDVRHVEEKNVIVALYAKGKARYDNSGFVQD